MGCDSLHAKLFTQSCMVDNYASFLNCTPVVLASNSYGGPDVKLFTAVAVCLLLVPPGFNWCSSSAPDFQKMLFGDHERTNDLGYLHGCLTPFEHVSLIQISLVLMFKIVVYLSWYRLRFM